MNWSRPFEYRRPQTLEEALAEIMEEGAVVLAGGTDLVPMRAGGVVDPRSVVDVKSLVELQEFEETKDRLSIGACVPMTAIATLQSAAFGALRDGAAVVGAPQTRARATLGGNICRSSPAGDTLPGLLALGAHVELVSVAGTRQVPLAGFFTGPGTNICGSGELLTRVELVRQRGGSAYERQTYRKWMDLAVVGVAARVELSEATCVDAQVGAGAVAATPILVGDAAQILVGSDLSDDVIEAVCDAIVCAASPIDDVRGSRSYRLQSLRSLGRRVIKRAIARARHHERHGEVS